jgi:hypothetical protein
VGFIAEVVGIDPTVGRGHALITDTVPLLKLVM